MENWFPWTSRQLIQPATQATPRCGPLKSGLHQLWEGKAQPHAGEYEIGRERKSVASKRPSTYTNPKSPAHMFSTLGTLKGHLGGWCRIIKATFLGRISLTVYGQNQRTELSLVYKERPRQLALDVYRLWRHAIVLSSLTTSVPHDWFPNTYSFLSPSNSFPSHQEEKFKTDCIILQLKHSSAFIVHLE